NGGIDKLKTPEKSIFLGQYGTCLRFLLGVAILVCDEEITFTGEQRLLERPLKDLFDGIEQLGINVDYKPGEYVKVKRKLKNNINKIKMNGNSSSQFFTSILQIAPVLENGLEIEVIGDLVSKPYIDITINEMKSFGVKVENMDYKYFKVERQEYGIDNSGIISTNINNEILIEGDASALSYIACYIALHGGEIEINNIGKNSKQGDYKFLDEMKIFGLAYTSQGETTILKAPGINKVDLSKYKNYKVDFENMPDVSMSFMIMSIFLPGITTITGLKTLNLKECLRIDAMRDELRKLGIEVQSDSESIKIGEYKKCRDNSLIISTNIDIETYSDHRIAMCFGTLNTFILGLNILNPSCVSKTYPEFWKDLEMLTK
ncbi:MAG: hypothetical protein PHE25_05780, partial [Candidatus Gracilibacteria bacterium]|nr:hypothetical protein [Candidatus Gracilibacteria bacterium]